MCDIYPMMRQFALGMLMLTAGANLLAQGAEINWIKVDELEAAQARESRKVMIDVYTKWCGPCKKLEPLVHEIAGDYGDRLKVVKVDVDKAPTTAAKFAVLSVPTLLLFRDGQVRDQVTGLVPKRAIAERVDKVL